MNLHLPVDRKIVAVTVGIGFGDNSSVLHEMNLDDPEGIEVKWGDRWTIVTTSTKEVAFQTDVIVRLIKEFEK